MLQVLLSTVVGRNTPFEVFYGRKHNMTANRVDDSSNEPVVMELDMECEEILVSFGEILSHVQYTVINGTVKISITFQFKYLCRMNQITSTKKCMNRGPRKQVQ